MQGREFRPIAGFHVRVAVDEQEGYRFAGVFLDREMQCRFAEVTSGIDVCFVGEEEGENLQGFFFGGGSGVSEGESMMQGCPAVVVGRVDAGTTDREQVYNCRVQVGAGVHQGRGADGASCFDVGVVVEKKADGRFVALGCGTQ